MVRLKRFAFLFAVAIVLLLSSTLISSVVIAQGSSNSDASLAQPYIIIFGSDGRPMYSPDTSPYVFHTDGENATIRMRIGMPRVNSIDVQDNGVTSVCINASWEKDQNVVLYTGAGEPLFFDLEVPIGNQHIEVYATGMIHIFDDIFTSSSFRTVYGNRTNSYNFIVAPTNTPTPYMPPRNAPHLDPIYYLIHVAVIVAIVIASLLLYRRHRKTANNKRKS
jgi:hypothetical protein